MKVAVHHLGEDSAIVEVADAVTGRAYQFGVTGPRPAGATPAIKEDVSVLISDRTGQRWARVEVPES